MQKRHRTFTNIMHAWGLWLVRSLRLQLFLTLISWPILLFWGIPLSYVSIVGNLLFSPFLTAFLLLSSCLFFCTLFSLDTTLIAAVLEGLSRIWILGLETSERSWNLGYGKPPLYIALTLPVCASALISHKKLFSPLKSCCALLIMLLLTSGYLSLSRPQNEVLEFPFFDHELTLIVCEGNTLLLDPGIIGRRVSAPSCVGYTLVPSLIKKGLRSLDIVVCTQPSATVFRSLTTLIELMPVKILYLPAWIPAQSGILKNQGWQAWEQLISSAQRFSTQVHLLTDDQQVTVGTKMFVLHLTARVTTRNGLCYKKIQMTEKIHDY